MDNRRQQKPAVLDKGLPIYLNTRGWFLEQKPRGHQRYILSISVLVEFDPGNGVRGKR